MKQTKASFVDTSTKDPEKVPKQRSSRIVVKAGGSSVFDRLYSTKTESSKIRKTTGPAVAKDVLGIDSRNNRTSRDLQRRGLENEKRQVRRRNTVRSQKINQRPQNQNEEVFNRLYQSSTSCSALKGNMQRKETSSVPK